MINKNLFKIKFKIISQNKNCYHKYDIKKELEAGLILKGWEVKAIRAGQININNSYILFEKKQAYVIGINIQPLRFNSFTKICNSIKKHKLLLTKKELNLIYLMLNSNNQIIVALALYWKKSWVKLLIGIAKGKKKHDKRASIKNREWLIEKNRIIKRLYK